MEIDAAFAAMREVVSEERWMGARVLVEGAAPTHARVAACLGVHVTTLSNRAVDEGWKSLDFRRAPVRAAHRALIELAARARAGEELGPPEPLVMEADAPEETGWGGQALPPELEPSPDETPDERLARMADMVLRRADAMLRAAEAGRPLDPRQISGLVAMMQFAERVTPLARERTAVRQADRDEETAEVIAAIEAQIELFAKDYARRILVARGVDEAEAAEAVEEIVAARAA